MAAAELQLDYQLVLMWPNTSLHEWCSTRWGLLEVTISQTTIRTFMISRWVCLTTRLQCTHVRVYTNWWFSYQFHFMMWINKTVSPAPINTQWSQYERWNWSCTLSSPTDTNKYWKRIKFCTPTAVPSNRLQLATQRLAAENFLNAYALCPCGAKHSSTFWQKPACRLLPK